MEGEQGRERQVLIVPRGSSGWTAAQACSADTAASRASGPASGEEVGTGLPFLLTICVELTGAQLILRKN